MKASQLVGTSLVHDGTVQSAGTITDIAVEPGRDTIPHILVDVASDTGGVTPVLFAGSVVRLRDGALRMTLTEAELASRLEEAEAQRRADAEEDGGEGAGLDPRMMPPVVVGPFGYTIAPALMASLLSARLEKTERPDLPRNAAAWVSQISGQPAFDASGELGTLEDFEIDAERMVCVGCFVREPAGTLLAMPFSALRPLPDKGTHVLVQGGKGPLDPVET